MSDFKIEILSKKLIQPSKPTPENIRRYNLSLFDEYAPPCYSSVLYYYLSEGDNGKATCDERCHKLEKSLSQILTKFYLLAGRYMADELSVHCEDQGVECIEAQVNRELSHFLQPSDSQMCILSKFLPEYVYTMHSSVSPLLVVQINSFNCGGIVLGIAISHVVADAFTIATFMNEWAKTSGAEMREDVCPSFGHLSSLFPVGTASLPKPWTSPPSNKPSPPTAAPVNLVTKIFWFHETKIVSTKESMAELDGHFSKVVVVTAMIWKALLEVSLAKHGYYRDSVVSMAMNIRGRSKAAPPTLDISFGNCVMSLNVLFEAKKGNTKLHDLMVLLRSAVEKQRVRFEGASVDDISSMHLKGFEEMIQGFCSGADFYLCTSWCRFPMYEADFGWGKPHWVIDALRNLRGAIVLMDSNSGGIQASITLSEEDMNIFQKNLDIPAPNASS